MFNFSTGAICHRNLFQLSSIKQVNILISSFFFFVTVSHSNRVYPLNSFWYLETFYVYYFTLKSNWMERKYLKVEPLNIPQVVKAFDADREKKLRNTFSPTISFLCVHSMKTLKIYFCIRYNCCCIINNMFTVLERSERSPHFFNVYLICSVTTRELHWSKFYAFVYIQ